QPEFTASIVAAEMTELIPGVGPPPHGTPSLGLRSPMGDPRRVRAWRHSLASGGGVSQATPGRDGGVRCRGAAGREERMPPRRKTVYGERGGSPCRRTGSPRRSARCASACAASSTTRLEGDNWVVNAHKWFTSGANRAAFTTVFAITEPEAAPHERFSAIIVPTDAVGYEILRVVPTMGHTGGAHCEIRLSDVRVPR